MKRLNIVFLLLCSSLLLKAQNIGIGTPSPDYTLDVNGSVGINDFIYHNNNGDDAWIGFPGNNIFEIVVKNNRIAVADGNSKDFIVNPDYNDINFSIVAEDVVEHLFHAETGQYRIGIGNTNPNYLLDVGGLMGIADYIVHSGNDDTRMGFPADDQWELMAKNTQMLRAYGNEKELVVNPDNDNIKFIIRANGSGDLLMVDAYNQFIGIGTSNPQELLDVAGTLAVNSLKVGGNTVDWLSNIQEGTISLSSNNSGTPFEIPISFPNAFTNNPKIQITIENTSDAGNTIFISSVRSVTTDGASIIVHSSNGTAWTTDLNIHWMAWE